MDVCEDSFFQPGLTYLTNIFVYFAKDKTDPDPLQLLTYCMKLFCFFSQPCPNSEDILSQDLFVCLFTLCVVQRQMCVYMHMCAHACRCQKTVFEGFSSGSFPPLLFFFFSWACPLLTSNLTSSPGWLGKPVNFRIEPCLYQISQVQAYPITSTFKTPASESWTQGPQAYRASTAQTEGSFAFHQGF